MLAQKGRMKTLTVTKLVQGFKTAFDHIPLEGMVITRERVPIAIMMRPDKKAFKKDINAKAEAAVQDVKTVKIGTFGEKEVTPSGKLMGMCSLCGRQGELRKKMYVNENGVYYGKYLCVAKCFNGTGGAKIPTRIVPKEVTYNQVFGGTNEEIKKF
jgi:hypothetical protein